MSDYVYIRSEPGLWTVGYHEPGGKFIPESDHDSPGEAAAAVSVLNGGADETAMLRKLLTLPLQNRAPEVAELLRLLGRGEWGADQLGTLMEWLRGHGYVIEDVDA